MQTCLSKAGKIPSKALETMEKPFDLVAFLVGALSEFGQQLKFEEHDKPEGSSVMRQKKRQVLLSEAQWKILEPLFPAPRRRKDGRGRPWA